MDIMDQRTSVFSTPEPSTSWSSSTCISSSTPDNGLSSIVTDHPTPIPSKPTISFFKKSIKEGTILLPDKTVVERSKLNPNAKEFFFNPNTKPQYKLQRRQTENKAECLKKEYSEKSIENNTNRLLNKTILQKSKLNPNAKEFEGYC